MGNHGSNDPRPADPMSADTMSAENVSRLAASQNTPRLDIEAPAFHPKFYRSDTTNAQAGSPSMNGDPDTSASSSANSSFPLSDSAVPSNFDISADLPAQLSHFFPLPPTKLDSAANNSPSASSVQRTTMTALNDSMGQPSLQETLDALWAPPKHVPVRISAPVSPAVKSDAPLIDFFEPIPAMPSFASSSTVTARLSDDTSFEIRAHGIPSGQQSADDSSCNISAQPSREPSGGVQMCREETLTQLVASHPELNLGLESASKTSTDAARLDPAPQSGSSSFVSVGDEPIQLPPVTYADATNIASRFPELATKVLNEPLATPVKANIMLKEAEQSFGPVDDNFDPPPDEQNTSMNVEPPPGMPGHSPDHPNWALAPDDSESDCYSPRPVRRERRDFGGRRQSGFVQDQNDFDQQWQSGGRDHDRHRSRSNRGDRSGRDASRRSSGHGRGHGGQDNHTALNGPSRRGSREPSNNDNDRSHDMPPHLRANESHDQSYRTPPRPSATRPHLYNTTALVENSAPAGDEWAPIHDPWTAPAKTRQSAAPQGSSNDQVDDWTPKHDPWVVLANNSATETRDASQSQHPPPSQSLRTEPEVIGQKIFDTSDPHHSGRVATPANEWVASHDPWAVGADESKNHQSQMLELNDKREPPSTARGENSPFRDRVTENETRNGRFVEEARFSANVLDVRVPSQSSVAALAASRAGEMYDGDGHENAQSGNRENDPAAEFDYFLHSNTVDWTSPGPAKPAQNSFSPSQSLAQRSRVNISAPAPRAADYFDYDQQPDDHFGSPAIAGVPEVIPESHSFVLGSMKTDSVAHPDDGVSGRDKPRWGLRDDGNRSGGRDGPSRHGGSGDSPTYARADHDNRSPHDGGHGHGRDSASPGYGSPAYGRGRQGDDHGSPHASRGQGSPSSSQGDSSYKNRGNGSLPHMYSGPPRRTSYATPNFSLPPLDEC
ncbi:hypothetical protein B0H15DRAFT_829948 [Mycena belliarum]|uniref:Uncharacterized protein n=1 Tax=Mycena belliarum TaxID=1033014 RepID=A0AAD6U7Y3_9AGAR|nr:hypothetical protein B0H15DRAFT_829948 [Mycena belliae]